MIHETQPDSRRRRRCNRRYERHSGGRSISQELAAYKTVNGRDTDNIRVPGTARYRQLRVCVYGGPIHMRDVDIWFRNGRHQDIGTRNLMRAGTCTRNLDLRGHYRDVTRVRLKYAPLARGWVRPLVRVQVR